MSIDRHFAERRTSSNFVASNSTSISDPELNFLTYLFEDSEIKTYLTNGPYKPAINGNMIIFNNKSDFIIGCNDFWLNSGIPAEPVEVLYDLGKEINIGYKGGDSKLVTLRLVRRTNGGISSGGIGPTYWITVFNKLSSSSEFNQTPEFPYTLPVTVTRI